MLWDSNDKVFLKEILSVSQNKAKQLISEQDNRILQWQHNEILKQMSSDLQPQRQNRFGPLGQILKLKKQQVQQIHFPDMYCRMNRNTYEQKNIFHKQKTRYSQNKPFLQGSNLDQRNSQKSKEVKQNMEVLSNHRVLSFEKKSEKSQIQKQEINTTEIKHSPFVDNNNNYFDVHANTKKTVISPYSYALFNESTPNISALAHRNKLNAFTGINVFPTTIMKGNISNPMSSMFKTHSKVDISDVMRYTLGQTSQEKSQVLKTINNPFRHKPNNINRI